MSSQAFTTLNGNTTMDRPCRLCAGSGWIDEAQATALGLELPGGRTEICPHCEGAGDVPDRERRRDGKWVRDFLLILVGLAAAALVLGAMVGLMVWALRNMGAMLAAG